MQRQRVRCRARGICNSRGTHDELPAQDMCSPEDHSTDIEYSRRFHAVSRMQQYVRSHKCSSPPSLPNIDSNPCGESTQILRKKPVKLACLEFDITPADVETIPTDCLPIGCLPAAFSLNCDPFSTLPSDLAMWPASAGGAGSDADH